MKPDRRGSGPSTSQGGQAAYRNGKDITNPRDWYCLLSEKVCCKHGIYGFNHPEDNSFLPQLAQELDLSYDVAKSSYAGGSTFRRSSISKSSSAYQHDSPIKRHSTRLFDLSPSMESTWTSFYKKQELETQKKKPSRVTFLDVPDYKRSVSFPKLKGVKTKGIIPETSVIENENLAHSHNENLEEWFSQMPDETTTKAKRKVMEQDIQESVLKKGVHTNVPIPKMTKSFKESMSNFPPCYKDLRSVNTEEPILIDRDIYKLQLKSLFKLNNGNPSMIDRLDKKKREYIVVSPVPREDFVYHRENVDSPSPSDHDSESALGFDPEECQLFIVSTKRSVPQESDSNQSFHHASMPRQKRLKRLKNVYGTKPMSRFQQYAESKDSCESGTTLLSLGENQYNPLTRQPKHIRETLRRQEHKVDTPVVVDNDSLPISEEVESKENIATSPRDFDKKKLARLAKYKPLEPFSENRRMLSPVSDFKIVEFSKRKEIPRLHHPVFKLDLKCYSPYFEIPNNDDNAEFKTIEDLIPLKIEKGVVIVGSAKSAKSSHRCVN
ncbi:hypothetical protein LOTGIDRAFT_169326 [Lottia gigantea]|uniref:Uncharacterized protein n=1 Tax=Lottia gigantea TaxID=225164 RepID=V3ZRF9_LOTGI|nr:hypothetical protein LOTGIDRAFT_169326 [Lottia gigantea]ESO83461.1 hypothetical protein LOTGIDRAFT_169326 [Lottia gigantea]